MPNNESFYLETPAQSGQCLRVTFSWQGDRFAHHVASCCDGRDVLLLCSREGDELDSWPPSPPLQQLDREALPDGRHALLLIGMAGRSHWSLSVAADPGKPELVFDVACRANRTPQQLGSAYHLVSPPPAGLHPMDEQERPASPACVLLMEPVDAETATQFVATAEDWAIICTPDDRSPPATYRWKYRLALP